MTEPLQYHYEIEKIVRERKDDDGEVYYLIKWKNYSSSHNTWEPAENIPETTIERYNTSH
jgi:hypothetical protein